MDEQLERLAEIIYQGACLLWHDAPEDTTTTETVALARELWDETVRQLTGEAIE